ncbi:TonB-dependent receptor [uncultured Cyclobacterium sp.]|uniref:TonB-dependent receptor plug domain-containing protein n=1 Tax=uncultured Cyclobacterium sp. TaxID=453820 RepID=UPI0030EE5817|tara:strand:+ start:12766 stop:14592 length:1827 start_codon:yes stop_codon:yes gene_type:complete
MKYCLLLSILLLRGLTTLAQNDSITHTLEEVIIRENRMKIPFSQSSRNISIIHRKEIETTPGRSLQEILSFTPGVDVRQRGVSGVQADIGIRGGSFEQTLMLVNGIKLSDPQTGHHMVNIPVPLSSVQRIDVLKGPASRIYGQNAYAGAINIITELSDSFHLNGGIYGGDFGMRGGSIQASLPIGKFKQNISFAHDASEGHWHNSDYTINTFFYEAGIALTNSQELKTILSFANRDFGANGFYTSSFPDQWESIQTSLAAVSHTLEKGNTYLQTRAYWRSNKDEFRLVRDDPSFFQNQHTTNVYAIEINGRQDTDFGTVGYGVEGRQEEIDSNNLGLRERTIMGAFLEHRMNFLKFGDIRAGLYSNYYSEYGWKHFPGAEVGYQLNPWLRTYANFGMSFRIPTYTDLYYVGPTNIGNEELKPEKAINYEGGFKIIKQGFRAEIVYFNRHTDNLIEWTRDDDESPWKPQNFNEVTFQGIETGLQYQFADSQKDFKFREVSISYNYIDANLIEKEGIETRYSLTALRHQLITGLQLMFKESFELTAKMRYIERMSLDPYFLFDARLDYNRLKQFSFFTEVSNIGNVDYVEAGTVQMPGRWARAGMNFRLK